MNIGIIGNGFVGKSTQILKNDRVNVYCYDINPNLCNPIGLVMNDLIKCDIIFISVPTPMDKDGSIHLNIVKNVISDIRDIKYEGFIVVRSTVLPGTCDKLGVYFMPEFLTEKNYLNDFKSNPLWIFGLLNSDRDKLFQEKIINLLDLAYDSGCIYSNKIEWMSNKEAEMVKYFRNTFLAVKVSYCNEIAEYCKIKNIDYNRVREISCLDKRIGISHTQVPGHDGKKGYGGTCFPKDTNALLCDMNSNNMESLILSSSIKRNELVDRKDKEWLLDQGRAII